MACLSGWEQPPDPVEDWRIPATRAELLAELELCGVPVDMSARDARCVLELSGTWAPVSRLRDAQRVRRESVPVS
ncbi:hypothetical protein C6W10_13400 [Plantactinospora sp. BB1]|nr:hypothetical protein C6W10_13400 [Plantactinospora sp. BB1]